MDGRTKSPEAMSPFNFFEVQVIYLLFSINSPSFKVLGPTVFEIFSDKVKMSKKIKGHNS